MGETAKSSLSSKLKSAQEETLSLRNQFEESQYTNESLQHQLNISTEENTKTVVQLEKLYNQMNNLLSEHEECPTSIASLENCVSSLQKQLMDKDKLVESLKEEQNIIMESNIEAIHERDLEVERLKNISNSNSDYEQELANVKAILQN